MGISERKAKEKEHLKALILEGAKKLFLEKGIEQTTIRSIAKSIDYSVGTVYVYYKDKNSILNDLHKMGFIEMGKQISPLFHVCDPIERLKALGKVYINFALENPDMYDLMFLMNAPIEFLEENIKKDALKESEEHNLLNQQEWQEGKGTFSVLRQTVQDCIDKGHFENHETEALSFMIWGMVHGICSLQIRGRVNHIKFKNPETILWRAFNSFNLMIDTVK